MKCRGEISARTGVVTAAKGSTSVYGSVSSSGDGNVYGGTTTANRLHVYLKDVSGGGTFSALANFAEGIVAEAGQRLTIFSLKLRDKQWMRSNPDGIVVAVINHDLDLPWQWPGTIDLIYTANNFGKIFGAVLFFLLPGLLIFLLSTAVLFAALDNFDKIGAQNLAVSLFFFGLGAFLLLKAFGDFSFTSRMKRESKRVQKELSKMMQQSGA